MSKSAKVFGAHFKVSIKLIDQVWKHFKGVFHNPACMQGMNAANLIMHKIKSDSRSTLKVSCRRAPLLMRGADDDVSGVDRVRPRVRRVGQPLLQVCRPGGGVRDRALIHGSCGNFEFSQFNCHST